MMMLDELSAAIAAAAPLADTIAAGIAEIDDVLTIDQLRALAAIVAPFAARATHASALIERQIAAREARLAAP